MYYLALPWRYLVLLHTVQSEQLVSKTAPTEADKEGAKVVENPLVPTEPIKEVPVNKEKETPTAGLQLIAVLCY